MLLTLCECNTKKAEKAAFFLMSLSPNDGHGTLSLFLSRSHSLPACAADLELRSKSENFARNRPSSPGGGREHTTGVLTLQVQQTGSLLFGLPAGS